MDADTAFKEIRLLAATKALIVLLESGWEPQGITESQLCGWRFAIQSIRNTPQFRAVKEALKCDDAKRAVLWAVREGWVAHSEAAQLLGISIRDLIDLLEQK